MSLLGRLDAFNLHEDNWLEYWDMVEQYFIANGIETEEKRTATFLTIIGKETYSLLFSLTAPKKPSSMKVDELNKTLGDHLAPKPIVIAERYKFYNRVQTDGESIADYIAELRRLSLHCDFQTFLEQALRDKLVCGLRDSGIRRKLLSTKDLDLNQAIDSAKGMESAKVQNENMDFKSVNNYFIRQKDGRRRCYRCDSETHLANTCRHKETVCRKCNRKGHLAKACRMTKANTRVNNTAISTNENIEENEVYYINKMVTRQPLKVNVKVNGIPVEFEIDTGSGLSIMSEEMYKTYFLNEQLHNDNVVIKTYSNEKLDVLGKLVITVEYNHNTYDKLYLYVIKGNGVNLIGRDWLSVIRMNWNQIFSNINLSYQKFTNVNYTDMNHKKLDVLINRYASIFSDKVGTIKDFKAKLNVKADAKPKYCRARTVPFSMQDLVEKEIDRLENEGVFHSISFSEWASPIVIVPKPNGSIRICGDFKNTVNPIIENEVYPIPSVDEVFAKVQGGVRFSKVDLTEVEYIGFIINKDGYRINNKSDVFHLGCKEATVLQELHNQHPGIVKMKMLSRMHVWFPGIDRRIEEMVKNCNECLKVAREPHKSITHPWSYPIKPMDRIHLDFCEYDGQVYLVLVDSFSKWMDVSLIMCVNTMNTIKILKHWFSIYGLPNQVVTDNGRQFTSNQFKSFMKQNGINHMCTPAYHQSTNGQVERYVQILKKGLKLNSKSAASSQEVVDEILMFHRSTPSRATGETPAKIFMGREIQTRIDVMKPQRVEIVKSTVPYKNKYRQSVIRNLGVGDIVQMRNYSSRNKWVRGCITRKVGNKMYEVRSGGKLYVRHIDQLLRINSKFKEDTDNDDDWDFDIDTPTRGVRHTRRYPQRIRHPVVRYGIDD